MKRIIYGVGLFLAIFCESGFLLSYQISSLKERMNQLEESSAQAMQQVSALSSPRDQEYIVEGYEDGQLLRNRYSVTAYSQTGVVLRQEESRQEQEEGEFLLKVENDYITVYTKKDSQVYEYTNIPLDALPEEMKREVLLGKDLTGRRRAVQFFRKLFQLIIPGILLPGFKRNVPAH